MPVLLFLLIVSMPAQASLRKFVERRIKPHAKTVYSAVVREGKKHKIDPKILASVIETESTFQPRKRGRNGEIGLMQIKPSTARWIAQKKGLPWNGPKSLEDPETNILLGTAYLSELKKEFSGDKHLYLSAYNMGSGNVRKALKKSVRPKRYAKKVLKNYRLISQLD